MRYIYHNKVKLGLISISLFLLHLMPIIDALSGWITLVGYSLFNIGQLYRLVIFILFISLIIKYTGNNEKQILMILLVMMFLQIILFFSNAFSIIMAWMKLMTPIIIFMTYKRLLDKKRIAISSIYILLDFWAVAYPIAFIIPKLFNISVTAAYDGTTGYKGFFYAVNEISFVLSVIVMYLFVQLEKKVNLKYIILLIIDCLCILLTGTKSGLLTVLLFGFFYSARSIMLNKNKGTKRLMILVLITVAIFIVYRLYNNQINAIVQRWLWQRKNVSNSNFDFLTSGRIRRIEQGFHMFNEDICYFLFGWGLGLGYLHIGIEMDFFDLLFGIGIIGFVIIMTIYIGFYLINCTKDFWNFLMIITSVILCCFAGHVLYCGQSGMALGILIVFNYFRSVEMKKTTRGLMKNE